VCRGRIGYPLQSSDSRLTEAVPLERVISTSALNRRPTRAPNHAAENRALVRLAQGMAQSPREILQILTDEALELCRAGSAGISIIENDGDGQIFRWHALSGALSPHLWGTTPRNFSPCGTVVDRNCVELMSHLERHFLYFADVRPEIVEALLVPFTINGKTIGTVWVVMHDEDHQFDLEDERLLKDLAEFAGAAYHLRLALETSTDTDRRKDEFLATVAHELRNPLSAARTASQYVHLRLQTMAEPKLQAMNELGQRQLISMSRMIDDLLDIARIRLDKIELQKERVNLCAIAQQAVASCLGVIEAARHELTVSVPDEPIWVLGDPVRLTQLVSNLLNNAGKYTPDRGAINLSFDRTSDSALIRVRDNGIGISHAMSSRIFDLYAQGNSARERAQGGLGIGLTIVRRLVELHGGHVAVHSDGVGKGSEFLVTLPLTSEPAEIGMSAQSLRSESTLARPLRILVVDDSRDSADSMVLLLSAHGHDVRAAYDGPSALEIAREFGPDVTLQDVAMPGMHGYEVGRQLRQMSNMRGATLIALSGYARNEDIQAAHLAGFDHHLSKPLDLEVLLRILGSL
jgi:signal transduction histidine kinase